MKGNHHSCGKHFSGLLVITLVRLLKCRNIFAVDVDVLSFQVLSYNLYISYVKILARVLSMKYLRFF